MVTQLLDDPIEDIDAPSANIKRILPSINPESTVYEKFRSGLARLERYYSGSVVRHSNHYVHERTTSFEPDTDVSTCEDRDPAEAELGALCDEVNTLISDRIVDINRKIYKALERSYDHYNSDEVVVYAIECNAYEFNEDGEREDDGGFQYAQLSDDAKGVARDWWREASNDDTWWADQVIEEWKEELSDMGFRDADISYSGFWSQGDGASFTCKRFCFDDWADWWASAKSTKRGHPYTDDLFLNESEDMDSPEAFNVRANLMSPVAQIMAKNGFVRCDQFGHERWIKHLSDGSMAQMLCVSGDDEYYPDRPYSQRGDGGPMWDFCRIPRQGQSILLAQGREQAMVYLIQGLMQRLATWPSNLPKPRL